MNTKNAKGTLNDEFKRIAKKYGYDSIADISEALDAGKIQRQDARKLMADLGNPISLLNTRDVMRARGIGDKPTPRTVEEASVQAAVEIILKILKSIFGICTTNDIEQNRERLEQTLHAFHLERNHEKAMQMLGNFREAANDDEFRISSTNKIWRP